MSSKSTANKYGDNTEPCLTPKSIFKMQILTTKYFSFQYSVTYCSQTLRRPAHRARETVHLLTHETPDFITPALWPANSPELTLTQSITRFGKERVCTAAMQIRDIDQLKSRLIEK